MPEFRATFLKAIMRTPKVTSYVFRPEENVGYLPGQFVQVIFDEIDRGNKDLNKYLSFSCRPGQGWFELTKKNSDSAFSGRLQGLKPGDKVLFKGPLGNCVFKAEEKKYGFLIGGIGITPVIAILDHITQNKLPTDICLLYSNWTLQDVSFKAELDAWAQANKNIKVVHTLVECRATDTRCFSGVITAQFVEQQMPDYKERMLYIVGPPGMVTAMQGICKELGCAPERVRAENFVGY